MKIKMKKLLAKTTFTKIILSYISVLIVPLIFGIILYTSAINMYTKDVEEANLQVLLNVKDSVNTNLSGMSNLIQALFCENNIIKLSTKTDYRNFDYLAMSNLQKKLAMSVMSNDYIEDILIYFNKSDVILTSKDFLNNPKQMTGYSAILGLSIQSFTNQLSQENNYNLKIFNEDKSKKAFLISSDVNNDRSPTPNTTILIRIKGDALKKLMQSENYQTFIFDKDGNYLSDSDKEAVTQEGDGWVLADNDKKYSLVKTDDKNFGISYVRFVPVELYYKNVFTLNMIALCFLMACLILGVPLAIFIAKMSYNPVKEILDLIPNTSSKKDKDDYKVICTSINELMQRNKDNQLKRDEQSISIRNYIFYRLLEDSNMTDAVFLNECSKIGISFVNSSFMLLHFYVENGSNLFFQEDENASGEMSHLLFIAIKNILLETMSGDYKFFIAEYKSSYYAVINIDSRLDKSVVVNEVKGCCDQLIYRLDKDFRVIISISISSIHSGIREIPLCYKEIMTIQKEQSCRKRSAYLVQYDEILAETEHTVGGDLHESIELVKRQDERTDSHILEICKYIDDNYSDPDLAVSSVSEKFGMNVANLSSYFKRKKGISPLEYIQKKRVRESRKLIATTDLKISEVAKAVGYFDPRPLIRSFKRIEGITPAEYREKKRTEKIL